MNIRHYKDSDYDTVCEWRKGHGKEPISLDFLPALGIIAEHENVPIAAAWLIKTDTKIGIIEHGISNPTARKSAVYRALRMVMDEMVNQAESLGLKQLWGIVCNRGISSIYSERGFLKQDGKFNVFVGVL